MNLQAVIDTLKKPLLAKGWKEVEKATSLEPDPEITDGPVALIFPGPSQPRGETRYDNFVGQVSRELFGVHIAAPSAELDQRRDEVQDLLLGQNLPGYTFATQYEGGKPTTIGRDIDWWADMYFTERDRRQQL